MKKLVVKAGLMVGSLLILGVAANAQTQYRAEIPWDFNAAGAAFAAGSYTVGQVGPSGPALILRNRKSGKARLLGHKNMGANWEGNGKLIFLKADGVYTLSEVQTPSFAIKMRKTKTDVRMASGSAAKLETVAIVLH